MISADPEKVFEFLSDPRYQNVFPAPRGVKVDRIEHLNSLAYGLGKKIRIHFKAHNQKYFMDLEVVKFERLKIIGYKLTKFNGKKRRKLTETSPQGLFPEFAYDLELERAAGKTRLRGIPHVNNIGSRFIKVLLYIFLGVFKWYENRRHIKKLGVLVERYV